MNSAGLAFADTGLPKKHLGAILKRSFYERPTLTVARELLGKLLVRRIGDAVVSGLIVEVEAYHQEGDQAAHTYNGMTKRNAVMFGPGGFLYVYFTYGMHYCMNVVTEHEGTGAAVLIRALEPVQGLPYMQRKRNNPARVRDLTNGPAKCCQALSIAREQNGVSLLDSEIRIFNTKHIPVGAVERSERIGIKKSTALDWRFTVKGNYFLSRNPGKDRLLRT